MKFLQIPVETWVALAVGVLVGVESFARFSARRLQEVWVEARDKGYAAGFSAGRELQRGRVAQVQIYRGKRP
jgi:hypothetical protein